MVEKLFLNCFATFPGMNDDTNEFLIITYDNYTIKQVYY